MENNQYETVLIVGNGFDLNFGLKTDYFNFLKSEQFTDLLVRQNKFAEYLYKKRDINNWIDIENELKNYSKSNPDNSKFFSEFKALREGLRIYLQTLKYNNLNKEYSAYKLIKTIIANPPVLIIDFNYTPTISNIPEDLKIDLNAQNTTIEHVKIHGSIDDGELIFGVEDKALISHKHIFLKKSINKNFDATNYNAIMKDCKTFIVFGHSLGETDHTYFQDFFSKATNSVSQKDKQKIYIFHYGEQSYFDLFAQIDSLTQRRVSTFKQLNTIKTSDVKRHDQEVSSLINVNNKRI